MGVKEKDCCEYLIFKKHCKTSNKILSTKLFKNFSSRINYFVRKISNNIILIVILITINKKIFKEDYYGKKNGYGYLFW